MPIALTGLLTKLVSTLGLFVAEHIDAVNSLRQPSTYLALFLRQLFALIDRGVVLELAQAYVDAIAIAPADHVSVQASKAYLRLEFLHVLCDSEYGAHLALPLATSPTSSAAPAVVSEWAAMHCRRHPLPALLARTVLLTLRQLRSSELARRAALATLVDALAKREFDARYGVGAARERIASAHLVLVLLLVDQWAEMADWRAAASLDERRSLYGCAGVASRRVASLHADRARRPAARCTSWRLPSARC